MVIRRMQAFEDMIAGLQQRAGETGELPAISLTPAGEPGGESITVRFDEGGNPDVSYQRGNVVLHGDEALVVGEDGSQQLFLFDSSGRVAGSLFVADDGEERAVDDAVSRQNLCAVESARMCYEEALAHPERFTVVKPFEE